MNFKKGLAIGVASLFLTSGVALADDSNFTGFSAGVFLGGSWANFDYQEADSGNPDPKINVSDLNGATFGLLVGYNHQVKNYVFGVEADFGTSGASHHLDGNNADDNDWSDFDVKWTSHIRAKVGMVFNENTLVYLAGGLALAKIENDDTWSEEYGDDTATLTGWTIGTGIEYLATENIALRLEYLYDKFGKEGTDITNIGEWDYTGYIDDLEIHTVRFAISYLF